MDSRARASGVQLLTLLKFMESHGDLAKPQAGAQGRLRSERLWGALTNILNCFGGGDNKSVNKWKKVWADWKSETTKKAMLIRRDASGTDGGPTAELELTDLEERVLAVMGTLAVDYKQALILELGLSTSTQPSTTVPMVKQELGYSEPSQSSAPTETISAAQDSKNLEIPILSDLSHFISPPSELPSTSPLPTSRACIQDHTPPVSTTPSRRRRSQTPATPYSEASPRRRRVLRRRAITPLERAASEFVALERHRLELEQTRLRQCHERKMQRLEVEQAQNRVLQALVQVAQAWLNFCVSKSNTQ